MSDVLFTEIEWRAVCDVEHFTDMDPDYFEYIGQFKKVLGGVFDSGNFWTGEVLAYGSRTDYHVVERDTGFIFGHAHGTRGEALAEARRLITDMGPLHLLRMLVRERIVYQAHLECEAEQQAKVAISAAKAKKPRNLSKRARAVFEASEGKCHYCQTALTLDGRWHIEHKFPRALFGGSEQENLVASCAPCNHAKRDKTDLEFIALVAERKLLTQQTGES